MVRARKNGHVASEIGMSAAMQPVFPYVSNSIESA